MGRADDVPRYHFEIVPVPRSTRSGTDRTLRRVMSKMRCRCGHVIRDQTDGLPYKAELYPDADAETLWNGVVSVATSFLTALRAGERLRWMKEHFLPAYPADVSDEGMLADAITSVTIRLKRDVYQCERCGRLYVQLSSKTNTFAVFAPESLDARACLRSENATA